MDALASVEVKPAVKHVLSREMRMYYERVVTAIFPDEDIPIENQEVGAKPTIAEEKIRLRDAALTSLAEDPGLHQLLPYLIQCVLDKITRNLRRLDVLTAALSTLNALLSNNNLFVEPYVSNNVAEMT
jgi:transcription initiation factor TFIID subunit 6